MAGLTDGKAVLLTGAAHGIGRAAALLFAAEGASILCNDINEAGGAETVDLVRKRGGNAEFVPGDVSQEAVMQTLVDSTVKHFGKLDCVVNNAGIEGDIVPVGEYELATFDKLVAINLRGVFLGMQLGIRQMLAQGTGGAIVNLSSICGLIGIPGLSPYVMSKHGVAGLTKTASVEYSRQGIRTNAVAPGAIQTRMLENLIQSTLPDADPEHGYDEAAPIGRHGKPEEVAETIVWLCSDRSSFVTGAILSVDGGYVAQ
ncbi:MAG: glucose 1-dehydrogenase [Pseudomonadota bacterium]